MMQSEKIQEFPIQIKPVYFTIVYYLILIPGVIWVNTHRGYGGGPCNLGWDLVFGLLLFFGSIVLMLINFLMVKLRGKQHLPSALIHLVVFVGTLLFSLIAGY
ncbi:hypothetical protein ACFQZI_10180 [Mucilaginibacter lutimaris]|uniref:Uncharacterized protein n=1 Tax=Mucilaginibacter lutimaris TaxID=931629 RepID=A0ABW2ZG67_9SPHI